MKRLFGMCIAVVLAGAALASAATEKRDVSITAPGGTLLKATYFSAGKPGPGILLQHQCNMDRKSWDDLGARLADAGFNVLTWDYPGFGESAGEKWQWGGDLGQAELYWKDKWGPAMGAAYQFLTSQKGVDQSAIGAGGASCGVYMTLLLAERHPNEVKALALLSGPTDADERTFLESHASLPLFLAASAEEKIFVDGNEQMKAHSKNARVELFHGAGHGTVMFDHEKGLEPMIVDFFKQQLKPSH
jgi:dienelactone hydrolase